MINHVIVSVAEPPAWLATRQVLALRCGYTTRGSVVACGPSLNPRGGGRYRLEWAGDPTEGTPARGCVLARRERYAVTVTVPVRRMSALLEPTRMLYVPPTTIQPWVTS